MRDNFRDGMQGMGLRPHQVQGQIYVACDPHDSTDSYHMRKIAEYIPGIHYIPTFRSGHVVATSISGSAAFKTLMDALLSGSPARVNHTVSEARRKNPTNIRYRMREGYARHPLLCYHMLVSLYDRADGRFRAVFEDEWLISVILYRLIRAGYTQEAGDLLANATSFRLTGRRARVTRTMTVASDTLVLSVHGYALSWNAERASFHGRTFITTPDNTSFLVFCHEAAGEKYASVVINTQRFYIRQDEKRFALTQSREEAGVLRFMQLPSEAAVQNGKNDSDGQLVVLRTSQGYACFHPDYNNHMDSPNLLDWEILTLCPLSPGLAGQTVEIPNDNNENVPAISQDEHTELTGTAVRL
ncbi:hypothetical protein GOB93_18585 [Acetobacter musti]|uniref:Uncharacterized protein n=1 Tax=Acetobacter musti TaxID=864732 RepID=A0ABX0JT03_9PROT|nr:hypothetical protein [Acetobacter musti]NHN86618.1 hypothetical protein [Acetobacter musti]